MKERQVTVCRNIWNEEKLRSFLEGTFASLLVQFGWKSAEQRAGMVSFFSKALDFSKYRNEVEITFSGCRFFFLDVVDTDLHFNESNRVVGPRGNLAPLQNSTIVGLEIYPQDHSEIAQSAKAFFAESAPQGFKGSYLGNHETHSVVWAFIDQRRFRARTEKLQVPVVSTREWVAKKMAEYGEVPGGNQ